MGRDVIGLQPRLCLVILGALAACASGEDSRGSGPGLGDDSAPTSEAGSETGGAGSGSGSGSAEATGHATTTGDPEGETTGCAEQSFYYDGDGDGHGDPLGEVVACSAPADHVPIGDDCDDGDPSNAPSLSEMCDGADNDCDGLVDEASPVNASCLGCTLGADAGRAYAYCPNPETFAAARTFCQQFGGDLLKIDDQAESDFLAGEPFPVSAGVGGYRHGLNDMRTEGTFVWTDGTAPSITPWGAGEPNDGAGAEDCVEFSPTTGIWNDVGCDEGRAFVCEAPSP